jgi:hypothetical protein
MGQIDDENIFADVSLTISDLTQLQWLHYSFRNTTPGAMSAYGTKRTSQCALAMSAFGGKADINGRQPDVCF